MAHDSFPTVAAPPKLKTKDVDKQTQALYGRLFWRGFVLAAAVFALINLVDPALVPGFYAGLLLLSLSLPLAFIGYGLVEGALVQVVNGLHENGDHRSSLTEVAWTTFGRFRALASVSLLSGFGVLLGFLLLVVPGFVLLTRWAVAVPVVMLEGLPARAALRRSRELVRGNGRAVFGVVFSVAIVTGLINRLFAVLGGDSFLGYWLCGTLSAALTVPYAAHAMTVLYYRLTEPERPVVQERGNRWPTIWDAERAASAAAER